MKKPACRLAVGVNELALAFLVALVSFLEAAGAVMLVLALASPNFLATCVGDR
jgi:hypothetical protein